MMSNDLVPKLFCFSFFLRKNKRKSKFLFLLKTFVFRLKNRKKEGVPQRRITNPNLPVGEKILFNRNRCLNLKFYSARGRLTR